MAYGFVRSIAIDNTFVQNTDQTDFPFMFSGTYLYLRTIANGGNVYNASGYDIIFSADADGITTYDFEIESYNATTGAVVFWVKLPLVHHDAQTVFYILYSNSAITTFQGNVNGTWSNGFLRVLHLSTDNLELDSSGHANFTYGGGGSTQITGKIDGALSSGGAVNIGSDTGLPYGTSDKTISLWVKSGNFSTFPWAPFIVYGNEGVSYGSISMAFFSGVGVNLQARGLSTFYSSSDAVVGDVPAVINTWYYVVLTYTQATTTANLYFNGSLLATGVRPLWDTVLLGHYSFGDNNSSTDEIRISGQARSSDWIAAEYHNQSSPSSFYTVGAIGGPITIITLTLPNGDLTATYSQLILATGGTVPYTWSVIAGSLPTGLSLNTSTGLISGTPTVAGTYNFTIQVDDSVLDTPDTQPYTVIINQAPTITCGSPPDGTIGFMYHHAFPATLGQTPYIYLITSGSLPTGLVLNSSTGVLSGLPTVAGTFPFVVEVMDVLGGIGTASCSITFAAAVPTPPSGGTINWDPGPGWTVQAICAREGNFGLRHLADGTTATGSASYVVSNGPITVVQGQVYFLSFWFQTAGGADGTVGFGFAFYDANDAYLSSSYITSAAHPTDWTQVVGTITVPANAVAAVPTVEVLNHIVNESSYCVDTVYAVLTGGNFIVSSIRHYFSDFTSYR